MRLEHYSQQQLKEDVRNIARHHLGTGEHQVFFFGSRVNDKGSERSDIDIGIRGKQPIPFHTLALMRGEFEGLPLLYKIDLVDFSSISEDFKNVALEHIESIL